jgi:ribosomal protein L1, bacterial/chloroplast
MPSKKEEQVSEKTKEQPKKRTNTVVPETTFSKAGKRSKKTISQKEEALKKEQRKSEPKNIESKATPKTRPIHERKSKKYKDSYTLIDHTKEYALEEAIELLPKTSKTKFDSSVEIHISLNIDRRHADHNIRDSLTLPYGNGKKIRVAIYSDDPELKKIGADLVGGDDFLQLLDRGELNFDVLITTPSLMPKLAKYAKLLGPRGLMPNPKSGTVTTDINKTYNDSRNGKIEYRVDSNGIIHCSVGKVSFEPVQILKNIEALIDSVKSNKPSSLKSTFIKSVYLTTTMGPSIKLNLANL